MSDAHRSTARQTGLKRYTWFLLGAWTIVVAGLFAWDVHTGHTEVCSTQERDCV